MAGPRRVDELGRPRHLQAGCIHFQWMSARDPDGGQGGLAYRPKEEGKCQKIQ